MNGWLYLGLGLGVGIFLVRLWWISAEPLCDGCGIYDVPLHDVLIGGRSKLGPDTELTLVMCDACLTKHRTGLVLWSSHDPYP
jgi:hypothetical protein